MLIIRTITSFAILASIFYIPWWAAALLLLVAIFFIDSYYEALALGLIADLFYIPLFSLFGFNHVFIPVAFFVALSTIYGIQFVKARIL